MLACVVLVIFCALLAACNAVSLNEALVGCVANLNVRQMVKVSCASCTEEDCWEPQHLYISVVYLTEAETSRLERCLGVA